MAFIERQDGVLADLTGVIADTILAGTTKTMSFTLQKDRIVNGFRYRADNSHPHDKITVQLWDSTDTVLLRQFGTNWYVLDSELILLYRGFFQTGMIFKVVYTSAGTTDVIFSANLYLHEEQEE